MKGLVHNPTPLHSPHQSIPAHHTALLSRHCTPSTAPHSHHTLSSTSGKLVAATTMTPSEALKPSSSTRS